jgi:hypothetical protein
MFARNRWKRWNRAFLFIFGVIMLSMTFSSTASAQRYDKKTTVMFSAPVEIPGPSAQVLPSGTYVFRLLDSLSDRNVVQIFNKDESHLYGTILAIPNFRLKATDKTVITFGERAAGDPQAIRAWFYPGDNWGQEFVYPKKKAIELAKIANVPVFFIPEEVAPNIVAPVKTATEPPVIALGKAPVMAVKPTEEIGPVTEVVEPPPVQTAARLPQTASDLPLLALLGFLCLSAGISLRQRCPR